MVGGRRPPVEDDLWWKRQFFSPSIYWATTFSRQKVFCTQNFLRAKMFSHKKVWTKSFLFLLKYFSKEVFRQNSYLQKCFLFPNFLLKFFLARKFYNKDKCCPQNFFWSKLSLTLIVYPTFCFIFLGWFLMIEPRYKNNKIFMDFDSIEMNLQGVPREVLKTKRPLLSTQSILLSKIGG